MTVLSDNQSRIQGHGLKFNKERMLGLKNMLRGEFEPVFSGKSVHMLDVPTYFNFGDIMIYMGVEHFFRSIPVRVKSCISIRNQNIFFRKLISKDDIIMCHGGGTFGDIYPAHQNFREKVVQQFPENEIYLMPQSMHYNTPENFERMISIYKHHKKLTLYVRDHESYDLLEPHLGVRVKMMPDTAHFLFGEYDMSPPSNSDPSKTLVFRRKDVESRRDDDGFDWQDLLSTWDWRIYKMFRFWTRVENKLGVSFGAVNLWAAYEERLINRAQRKYSSYNVIDTDRLHGAIFGLLMERDLILRDNSYGKLERYFSKWFS